MNNVRHVALLITLNLTPAQLSSRAESAASGGVEVAEEDRTQEGSSRPFSETEVQGPFARSGPPIFSHG